MNQKKLIIGIFIILTFVVGVFVWQKRENQILPQDLQLFNNQVQPDTQNDIQSKSDEVPPPQYIVVIPGSDSVWYEIPELGVRVKLNKKYAEDLIYRPVRLNNASGEEWDVAYFSTKTMTRIDPYCSPENVGSIGALSKNKGIAKELAKKDAYIASRLSSVVQIENFYYMFETPQAACWDSSFTEEVLKLDPNVMYEGKGIKFLIEGYKDLQLIPEKE